jgi:hypothetical protein
LFGSFITINQASHFENSDVCIKISCIAMLTPSDASLVTTITYRYRSSSVVHFTGSGRFLSETLFIAFSKVLVVVMTQITFSEVLTSTSLQPFICDNIILR